MIGEIFWGGLALGSLYVFTAVATNAVFIASGAFNFAQSQFMMLGTFTGFWVVHTLGLHIILAIVISGLIGVVIGLLEEIVAIRPLRNATNGGELVTTIGWTTIMQGVVILIWGSQNYKAPNGWIDHTVHELGAISYIDITLIILAIASAVGGELWLRRTRLGLAALATAEDPSAASLRGIATRRISLLAFSVGGGMLGAVGPLVEAKESAVWSLGSSVLLFAFVALAIGGFGSHIGALIGGMVVGIVQAAVQFTWGPDYENLTILVILLALLLVRPQGMFGRPGERAV